MILEKLNTLNNIIIENKENEIICNFDKNINIDTLLKNLEFIYNLQNQYEDIKILVNLKGLQIEKLAEAIKFALTFENLKDPLMILNIFNLIKIYNTLNDSFFENQYIYISNIQQLLDLKLEISNQLKKFIKQLSIYFISLFKSYNKTSFTPLDMHIQLPNIYKHIILAGDLITLSGIFSTSQPFDTSQCIYIDDAMYFVNELAFKSNIGLSFLNILFKE